MLHSVNEYITQLRNECAYSSVTANEAGLPMFKRDTDNALQIGQAARNPYGHTFEPRS